MRKMIISTLCIWCLIFGTEMGCLAAADPVDEKEILLDYYIWDDEEIYTSRVVDSFNDSHPGIRVLLHVIKNNLYDEQIKEVIHSEEKVDLIGIRGVTKIMDYHKQNLLLDLNDFLRKNDLDLTAYGNMAYSYTLDNKYYGLPTRSTYWVLYYNKDLFDKNDLPYPQQMTWEEYAQLTDRLTGVDQEGNKIWGGYFVDWCENFAGIQRQNYLYDDDISQTLESMQWLNRFYNVDKSHMPFQEVLQIGDDYIDVFESGCIALMPQGEWTANKLYEDELSGKTNINWNIAPMPVFDGQEEYTTWGQYQFSGITATCQYPEEAFEFLTYLCGEEGAKIYARSAMISGYMNDEIQEIYKNTLPGKNTEVFFLSQRNQECPAVAEYDVLNDIMKDASRAYLLGEISYEEACSKVEKERATLYE